MLISDNMKLIKSIIPIAILTLAILLLTSIGFAANNTSMEEHDFDSYFKMKVPKGTSFEKLDGISSKNINMTVNYKNETQKINIVYTVSKDAKDNLLKYYEEFAKNDKNITLDTTNNTTIIHFKGENIIGETNYHDLAISGDDEKYILMQCDNETLMKSMAESIRFA